MSISRIHRLLQLITMLESGKARSTQDLMSKLGVSRRTLFRDLKVLQSAGIPYYYDSALGYRIARSFFLPPINLTVPETLGLMLLAKLASHRRGWPLNDSAMVAISKLTATIPDPIRSACDDLMANVSVNPGAEEIDDRGNRFYPDLQRCIDEGRVCRIEYRSPVEPGPFECDLKPYALHFAARAWYVMGHSDRHGDVRMFKLARMISLEVLKQRFSRPRRFKVQDKLGKAWQLIPEGKVHRVELEFSAKVGMNVSEVLWHRTQTSRMLSDGRCRMSFEVDGLNEIAWWLCGYADQVMVLKPAALRQRVRQMHANAFAQYEPGTEHSNG